MTHLFRKALWAASALTALSLMACPTPPKVKDGGTTMNDDCIDSSDCADPIYFACNKATGKCEAACQTKANCDSRPAEYKLDECSGSLGCQCDEGSCKVALCSVDADCGTQVCRNGACVAAPAASAVAKCQITPDLNVFAAGSKARFWVSAWDAQNNPVIVKEGATWSAVGTAVTGSGTGATAEFTAGSAAVTTATAAIQAAFGTTTCQAKAIVLTPPSAGQVAVSVIDELSGRPVPQVRVMLSKTDGTVVQQSGQETVATDAAGYATLTLGAAGSEYSVSVFHQDYSYLTVANYSGSSRFLSFAIRRNSEQKYGGYKGNFTNVPKTDNVHAAVAGMSLAGAVTNLSLGSLLGPSVPTDIVIGTAINQQDVNIPAGAYLGFGDQKIKDGIAGQGLNGVCVDSSGNPDEAKIAAGECGTRSAWALAGDVALADLPIDLFSGGASGVDFGTLLARLVPLFKQFNSSVVRDVQFTMKDTPRTAAGLPDFSDQSHFTPLNHDFTQVPLAFSFAAKLPELPKYAGAYTDGVAVIGGAFVPGRGVVPLGIGAGVNSKPYDGQVDKFEPIDSKGTPLPVGNVGVRMAPTHHGLEGSLYGLLVTAVAAQSVTDQAAPGGTSGLFARLPSNKLAFDPSGTAAIDFSAQAFPVFPEDAKFNFSSVVDGTLAPRSFQMAGNLTKIDVVRVALNDDLDTRWEVLVAPGAPRFTLPPAPATFRDRVYGNGGARAELLVQALRLNKEATNINSASVSFNDFVEFNDTNGDRTTDFLTAISVLNYGRPNLAFTIPLTSGTTVLPKSDLVLDVGHFKIGTASTDDGVVKISFGGAAGCPEATISAEDMKKGSGVLKHPLANGCTGTNIAVRAELVKTDGTTPLAPPVVATTVINVQ